MAVWARLLAHSRVGPMSIQSCMWETCRYATAPYWGGAPADRNDLRSCASIAQQAAPRLAGKAHSLSSMLGVSPREDIMVWCRGVVLCRLLHSRMVTDKWPCEAPTEVVLAWLPCIALTRPSMIPGSRIIESTLWGWTGGARSAP